MGPQPDAAALLSAALAQLAWAERNRGRPAESAELVELAADMLPADQPTPALSHVLGMQARDRLNHYRFPEVVPLARRAIEVAAAVGVPEIRPVVVLTDSPAGKPVALKLVGLSLAVIW